MKKNIFERYNRSDKGYSYVKYLFRNPTALNRKMALDFGMASRPFYHPCLLQISSCQTSNPTRVIKYLKKIYSCSHIDIYTYVAYRRRQAYNTNLYLYGLCLCSAATFHWLVASVCIRAFWCMLFWVLGQVGRLPRAPPEWETNGNVQFC